MSSTGSSSGDSILMAPSRLSMVLPSSVIDVGTGTRLAYARRVRSSSAVPSPMREPLRERQQEQDLLVLLASVEATDHPEVHQRQAPVIGQQDVARVRIAVENA